MIRLFDVIFSLLGLIFLSPLFLLICLFILLGKSNPLFMQERVGRNQEVFMLLKFRTMCRETASVATHLVDPSLITPVGKILRRTKLDELPQLLNVFLGQMSLVGPRPSLFNQHELIMARKRLSVFDARPGITGLAQLSGIDMSQPELLAEIDAQMLQKLSLFYYFKYIFLTIFGYGYGDKVKKRE